MKKFVTCMLVGIVLCSAVPFSAYAEDSALVYGDIAEIEDSDEKLIRVYIKDNPGVMGFKITLEYSEDELMIVSADSGNVNSKGMFMDNIGVKEGSFDILWNSTENSYDDGTVAEIAVKPLVSKPFEVKLRYSQEDTFDESFSDVVFTCENIVCGEDTEPVAVTTNKDYEKKLEMEIYALPTEQSPGEFIENFLKSREEAEINSDNVSELHSEFVKEGLSEKLSEDLSEQELASVYNKILNEYKEKKYIKDTAGTAGKKGESGYNLPQWLIIAMPIALVICGGVIIIIHRRMNASEKQK